MNAKSQRPFPKRKKNKQKSKRKLLVLDLGDLAPLDKNYAGFIDYTKDMINRAVGITPRMLGVFEAILREESKENYGKLSEQLQRNQVRRPSRMRLMLNLDLYAKHFLGKETATKLLGYDPKIPSPEKSEHHDTES